MSDMFYYHKSEFVKVSIIVCKVESTCLSAKYQVALYGKQHTPVYKDAALSTPWNLKVSLCTHLFLPPTTLQETFGMPAAVRCQPQVRTPLLKTVVFFLEIIILFLKRIDIADRALFLHELIL